MSNGIDRLIAYKTMRAVQGPIEPPPGKKVGWRIKAARFVDRLLS